MRPLMLFASFIFGSIIGSFLNVVLDRIDTKESFIKGRSYCPYCKKTLSFLELIPILSFFLLKGRCLKCKNKISLQYPIVESLTALLFFLLTLRIFRFSFIPNFFLRFFSDFNLEKLIILINLIFWFYWLIVLILISIYDIKKYLILSEVLFPAIFISLIWKIFYGLYLIFSKRTFFSFQLTQFLGSYTYLFGIYSYFLSLFLGIFFSFLVISLIVYLSKERAMGWGDAILALFLGIILGWPAVLVSLILAFLIGGAVSFILILLKKKTLKSYVPFAPFLSLGALLVMLFGDIIIKGYLLLGI
ncbi:MAG: prepilin peptidase [Minisyncoccia bacterium]